MDLRRYFNTNKWNILYEARRVADALCGGNLGILHLISVCVISLTVVSIYFIRDFPPE